jgi:hypothetical protein
MKNYTVLLVLIFLQACSGGGDSVAPTAPVTPVPATPDTVFHLFEADYFTAGFTKAVNYAGTDTAGETWSAVISEQTKPQSTFLGQAAIPIFLKVELTNITAGSGTISTGHNYWSASASDRRYLGYSGVSTTADATTMAIPETARIGNSGSIGTYTDNALAVDVQSWRLEDGGNDLANFVQTSTLKNQSGTLEISSTTTTLIDTSGKTISQTIVLFFSNTGNTLTLTTK